MATVMVVDDVAANREIVRMLLGYRGHNVIEAHDGAEALRLARVHHPDVVVSDVLMPGIDGLELVHRLRADPDRKAAQAPVIFYTANYLEPETRPIAEACGVSQVVLRSQDPRTLLEAVDAALALGPVTLPMPAADADFTQAHLHAVNTKLIEKVRALHDTERRFEAMAVASPVGMGIIDTEGNADYLNPRLPDIVQLPVDRLLGRGWLDCVEPASRQPALSLLNGDGDTTEMRFDHRITRPDGTARRLRLHLRQIHDDDDRLTGGVLVVDDVTDLVSAEDRLRDETQRRQNEARDRDAERLDSLRRMAGGTAHDFNNILGAVLGYTNLAIESINDAVEDGTLPASAAESLLGDLGHVIKGGERAKGLTQKLLAFGRREIVQAAPINLNTVLREATGSLRETTGDAAELVLELDPRLPDVHADPIQITRAVHSLVRNSVDAMPAGGTVAVTTSVVDGQVTLEVRDTGTGMPPEVMERAFEPFFSTKPAGSTAGLGLSTAHGSVSQAGGRLTLLSREGNGTTATVALPAIATEAPAPPPEEESPQDNSGGETLLLVDDETALLHVSARMLSGAGYQVLTADDAGEALRILEQHPGHVSALVTDVVMPGMNGRQLAKVAAMRQPDLSIIFISGFAEALIDEAGNNLEPGSTVLAKPYDRETLVSTVRDTLNAAQHT